MTDLETLRTRLSEAESSLHALLTGTRVVKVTRDGRSLEYTSGSRSIEALKTYIAQLKAEIAEQTGEAVNDVRLNRRAYGPRFL
jgi:hypothetical protein